MSRVIVLASGVAALAAGGAYVMYIASPEHKYYGDSFSDWVSGKTHTPKETYEAAKKQSEDIEASEGRGDMVRKTSNPTTKEGKVTHRALATWKEYFTKLHPKSLESAEKFKEACIFSGDETTIVWSDDGKEMACWNREYYHVPTKDSYMKYPKTLKGKDVQVPAFFQQRIWSQFEIEETAKATNDPSKRKTVDKALDKYRKKHAGGLWSMYKLLRRMNPEEADKVGRTFITRERSKYKTKPEWLKPPNERKYVPDPPKTPEEREAERKRRQKSSEEIGGIPFQEAYRPR